MAAGVLMRRLIIMLAGSLAVCALPGCSDSKLPDQARTSAEAGSLPEPDSMLRLYTFDCGRIHFDDVSPFGLSGEETDIRELAAPCYMIEHSRGRLLWDGGLVSSLADTPGWQGEGNMTSRLEHTLAEQLAKLNLNLSSFDYVAFSHSHFDHVGIANELQGATVIMQRAEAEAAFGEQPEKFGFDPRLYAGLKDAETLTVDGLHDVFGDGRVNVLPAPGHTPGHQVLWVDLINTGPVVLSGDLYHFRYNYENKRVPEFNFDAAQTQASFEYIDKLISDTGAQLWIQHELAGFKSRKQAPEFYD